MTISSYKNLKTMNNGKILKGLELSRTDAERLVAECAEEIGGAGLPRAELMGRIRSVLRLGAEAMRARERTVSVREAAEAALAARQGLRPVTMRDLRYYTRRLCADAALAERPLRAVRAPECRAYLERTYGHSLPRNWNRRWQALRRAAGFSHWVPDVLRHTFATYHACTFRNLPALQCEMGHSSTALLRTRYVNTTAIAPRDARRFWATK